LLTLTLALFSVIVYAVAQYQFESSVDQGLQARAQTIAHTVQDELLPPAPSGTSTATPPTATATPKETPTTAASPVAGATATTAPTPVPTPDPAQSAKIQHQLQLSPSARDLLKQLGLTFEVLNINGGAVYYAPNIAPPANTGLPRDPAIINAALTSGACNAYTRSQGGALLRIYVYPIVLPPSSSGSSPATALACQGVSGGSIVGAVLVAKSIDDVNGTLATLGRLLLIGVIIAVLFASLGGWLIAGSGLQPLAAVTRTARAIARTAHGAGLGRRVGYTGPRDEVGELAETFDQMLAALERVANAQRRFVADASHELRAPLTTIKGSLELLRRARDLPEEERINALEDAYAEAERVTALVNDLLLLARADAAASGSAGSHEALLDDQMRGRRELVELDQLAMDIFRHGRAQLQARHKAAQLQIVVGTLEPVATMADPRQLRQVLLIPLDNAIKYTPAGGKITISVGRRNDRGAVSVTDTGIGIPPEVQPQIFDRFYRGEQARERDTHGSGLGLAIAQWIVDAHHGEIAVSSQPGQGSTFTILLPAIRRLGDQSSGKRPVAARKQGRPKVAGAIQPLARLASSVSRPRLSSRPIKKPHLSPSRREPKPPRATPPHATKPARRQDRPS
ncbi:MAG TPA: HAMP domain-containing sensor histidine kinase, partial [Ktedonobacterales bacterium]|nr:HAMP domain-containing sensor histidine kinase [Ktedonobacterales bacterium]